MASPSPQAGKGKGGDEPVGPPLVLHPNGKEQRMRDEEKMKVGVTSSRECLFVLLKLYLLISFDYHYDVMVGTKWKFTWKHVMFLCFHVRIYMKAPCFHLVPPFTPHYIIMVKSLLARALCLQYCPSSSADAKVELQSPPRGAHRPAEGADAAVCEPRPLLPALPRRLQAPPHCHCHPHQGEWVEAPVPEYLS